MIGSGVQSLVPSRADTRDRAPAPALVPTIDDLVHDHGADTTMVIMIMIMVDEEEARVVAWAIMAIAVHTRDPFHPHRRCATLLLHLAAWEESLHRLGIRPVLRQASPALALLVLSVISVTVTLIVLVGDDTRPKSRDEGVRLGVRFRF